MWDKDRQQQQVELSWYAGSSRSVGWVKPGHNFGMPFFVMRQRNAWLAWMVWRSKEKCLEVILLRFYGDYGWCTQFHFPRRAPQSQAFLLVRVDPVILSMFLFLLLPTCHCGLWIPEHIWGRHFLGAAWWRSISLKAVSFLGGHGGTAHKLLECPLKHGPCNIVHAMSLDV